MRLLRCLMVYRKKTDKLMDWNLHQYDFETINKSKVYDDYETSNVWQIDPVFDKVHCAVFPIELCDRVIKFYSMLEILFLIHLEEVVLWERLLHY